MTMPVPPIPARKTSKVPSIVGRCGLGMLGGVAGTGVGSLVPGSVMTVMNDGQSPSRQL